MYKRQAVDQSTNNVKLRNGRNIQMPKNKTIGPANRNICAQRSEQRDKNNYLVCAAMVAEKPEIFHVTTADE